MPPMDNRLLRPRASGRFDPRSIPGLFLWLDSADSSTVLNSISPDTPATNSQTVRRWLDKSGGNRHANQTSGANQPTRESAGVVFNGTSSFLSLPTSGLFRNVEYAGVFAVYSWANSPSALGVVFSVTTNNGAQGRVSVDGGRTANKFGVGGRRLDANSFQNVQSSENVSASAPLIHSAIFNYAAAKATQRLSGAVDGVIDPFQTAGSTSDTEPAIAGIGSFNATQFFAGITIREFLLYQGSAQTDAQVSAIERYLASKWGVTLA
jgi:hypothetical protein